MVPKKVHALDINDTDNDDDDFVAVVTEVNLVFDVKGWWIDTGATRHICLDKNMLSKYTKIVNGKKLFMGILSHQTWKEKTL